MQTIYKTSGAAAEYGELALNIYNGCPHRCFYCSVPKTIRKPKDEFHGDITPRKNIVEETEHYIKSNKLTGKLVHLCFSCDPYPTGFDSIATRNIIKLLKDSGNHVQILTKGSGVRDFDLLDENDWYGVTLDGTEDIDTAMPTRVDDLVAAHQAGIKTWVSFEPVVYPEVVLKEIKLVAPFVDMVKIGKLNHFPLSVDWKAFGNKAESLCKQLGLTYCIKDALRAEMLAE